MHALLIGATGATGKDLLTLLLNDPSFHRVDVFTRRELPVSHEKLNVHVINFDRPEEWRHLVKGDVLFSCLGTTLKAAGGKKAQWTIDYDYQYEFAKSARQNDVDTYVLVSSAFASARSIFFYSRMKGKLEEAVKHLGFNKLLIFQPPSLIRTNTDRPGEISAIKIITFLNRFGLLRSSRPLHTATLAEAMVNASKNQNINFQVYHADEIRKFAMTE